MPLSWQVSGAQRPSHTPALQVPGRPPTEHWLLSLLSKTHAPLTHALSVHSLLSSQSLSTVQATQLPWPSQVPPSGGAQALPAAEPGSGVQIGWLFESAEHTSGLQASLWSQGSDSQGSISWQLSSQKMPSGGSHSSPGSSCPLPHPCATVQSTSIVERAPLLLLPSGSRPLQLVNPSSETATMIWQRPTSVHSTVLTTVSHPLTVSQLAAVSPLLNMTLLHAPTACTPTVTGSPSGS